MNKHDRQFLFELLETPSPTGFEAPGQRLWAAHVAQHADRVENDAYGTAWAVLESGRRNARRIMLEAHADEIGFIVKYITSEGFVHIDRIGGSDAATARGRRLRILGDKGPVTGIVGNTAIHIRENRDDEKAPKIHELYVDVGASSRGEVEAMGIRAGSPAVYQDATEEFANGRLVGRALDNRLGGFIIARVLARLAKDKKRPAFDVVAVNAVQEEVGGNGAIMVTHRLRPDVALCLDVTHATDTPGIKKEMHGEVRLGGGPSVTHGTCNHPNVVRRLLDVADREKIPVQHESTSRFSGTDTDRIFRSRDGVPSGLVSLPLRYMHSVVEMVDLADVERVIDLMTGFVRSLKPDDDFALKLI